MLFYKVHEEPLPPDQMRRAGSWNGAASLGKLLNLISLNTTQAPCPYRFLTRLMIQLITPEQERKPFINVIKTNPRSHI